MTPSDLFDQIEEAFLAGVFVLCWTALFFLAGYGLGFLTSKLLGC